MMNARHIFSVIQAATPQECRTALAMGLDDNEGLHMCMTEALVGERWEEESSPMRIGILEFDGWNLIYEEDGQCHLTGIDFETREDAKWAAKVFSDFIHGKEYAHNP